MCLYVVIIFNMCYWILNVIDVYCKYKGRYKMNVNSNYYYLLGRNIYVLIVIINVLINKLIEECFIYV